MMDEEEASSVEESSNVENPVNEESPENTGEENDIERTLEEIRAEVGKKLDRSELEEIKTWKANLLSELEKLKSSVEELKKEDERVLSNFREFTDIITKKNEDMKKVVEKKVDETKMGLLKKDISKMSRKMGSLMEETGFGEIIDVTKIPPNILEIVYDSTLKDISLALWREYGPGAERIIMDTLEEIRLETSGSEMFHYDGRYIKTRDVAKNIRRGMISAKQLQDTYEALLHSLHEKVPSYKPKNFKAMIKLKSQEYTVDKVTYLLERTEKIENTLSMIDGMVSTAIKGLSTQSERTGNIERAQAEMEKRLDEALALRDERISALESALSESKEELRRAITSMDKRTEKRIQEIENAVRALTEPSESTARKGKEVKKEGKKSGKKEENIDTTDEERFVLSAIPKEGITMTKLRKMSENFIGKDPSKVLESLVSKGLVKEEKKGKGRRYYLNSRSEGEKEKKEGTEKGDEKRAKKEEMILNAIPINGSTLNRLKRILEKKLSEKEIAGTLDMLVENGVLTVIKRGRYKIYKRKEEKIGGEKNA